MYRFHHFTFVLVDDVFYSCIREEDKLAINNVLSSFTWWFSLNYLMNSTIKLLVMYLYFNFSGIIHALKQLIHSGWLNSRWNLISVDCDHFASEPWEKNFACCYRNAQCILSSLFRIPEFRKRLFGCEYNIQ